MSPFFVLGCIFLFPIILHIYFSQVYYISKAKIQTARKQFSNVENEYEMSLDQGTTIVECTDSTGNVPGIRYKFVGLSNLEQLEKDSFVGKYV